MRIAYFADSLPPSIDGVARTFVQLIRTLEDENLQFRIFSPFKPDEDYLWTRHVTLVQSVPLFLYPHYRIGLPVFQNLRQSLDDFKPDIVHCSSPTFMGTYGENYARRKGIPAVSSYHTDFISYFKYYRADHLKELGWRYLRWFYNRFDRVYVPSTTTARILYQKEFENIELWQRGIDTSRFSPEKRNEGWRRQVSPEGHPVLMFVGRLVKEKDLDDLVEASRMLEHRKQAFKLVIVGGGPMREELETALPRAHFTGYLDHESLAELYASADIFVFPSTTETFGNVILEANASGLPVVGVNAGGVMDLIEAGKTGLIAQANNPQSLAENIELLLRKDSLRRSMGEAGREHARKFSWPHINSGLLRSYQNIIDWNANRN